MIVYVIFLIIILCFGFVLLYGAPYLPTHKRQINIALTLLDLKPDAVVYELGCGDGAVLKAIAQHGYRAIGYELNPLLVVIAYIRTYRYRGQISIRWSNFWRADLSEADGVYVFLLDKFMKKLDTKLSQELKPNVKLASYTFKIPSKKIYKQSQAIFVYKY